MTADEHLKKIVAKCRELLAVAEKRTQGKWECVHTSIRGQSLLIRGLTLDARIRLSGQMADADAAFIANCAGPAEAGWRATIAAVESLRAANGPCAFDDSACHGLQQIIAAWPEELL